MRFYIDTCVITEADTCRKYVLPKLYAAGWNDDQISEQKSFTDGRIIPGAKTRRRPAKRADYLLRYARDFMLAVVEAKAAYKLPGDGLQQAKDYAAILGVKFAYSTNGHGIVEFDSTTGKERHLDAFPKPADLWARFRDSEKIEDEATASRLLTPANAAIGKGQRYYQEIAINRVVQAVLQGKKRILLTMATGTGKTAVAFQICWKLWNMRWNRAGEHRRPKILYLADRNILIDDPKDKMFTTFGDARWKIENGEVNKGRELYFAIYQAIAKDEHRPGLYKEYSKDFFDLIIVDECHRGSAKDDSNWREILRYFQPAFQLGMTATPLREDNRDTIATSVIRFTRILCARASRTGFSRPIGFTVSSPSGCSRLAAEPGRRRSLRPRNPRQRVSDGRLRARRRAQGRTQAIARNITDFLKKTDRFAKTIVFCVDQEHADDMRGALNNLNDDLVKKYPDYVCRITSDEGTVGKGLLSKFQELETVTPVLVTTSQLLTTGVDIPTCKNIVIARVVSSMVDFKQIIGRGTRVRDDYGKYYFNILDYTGSATRLFADPDFDGEPALVTEEEMNDEGEIISHTVQTDSLIGEEDIEMPPSIADDSEGVRRKYYFDGGHVEIAAHLVYELDPDGRQLRVVKFSEYAADKVRTIYPSAADLRKQWADPALRAEIISKLEERGIDFDQLRETSNQPEAYPFDLLCHLAFNGPLRTRRERADRVKKDEKSFFEKYGPEARAILTDLLEKYAEHGTAQFVIPDVLKVPPISERGNVIEIAKLFGGPEKLRDAVSELQALLYAA